MPALNMLGDVSRKVRARAFCAAFEGRSTGANAGRTAHIDPFGRRSIARPASWSLPLFHALSQPTVASRASSHDQPEMNRHISSPVARRQIVLIIRSLASRIDAKRIAASSQPAVAYNTMNLTRSTAHSVTILWIVLSSPRSFSAEGSRFRPAWPKHAEVVPITVIAHPLQLKPSPWAAFPSPGRPLRLSFGQSRSDQEAHRQLWSVDGVPCHGHDQHR